MAGWSILLGRCFWMLCLTECTQDAPLQSKLSSHAMGGETETQECAVRIRIKYEQSIGFAAFLQVGLFMPGSRVTVVNSETDLQVRGPEKSSNMGCSEQMMGGCWMATGIHTHPVSPPAPPRKASCYGAPRKSRLSALDLQASSQTQRQCGPMGCKARPHCGDVTSTSWQQLCFLSPGQPCLRTHS